MEHAFVEAMAWLFWIALVVAVVYVAYALFGKIAIWLAVRRVQRRMEARRQAKDTLGAMSYVAVRETASLNSWADSLDISHAPSDDELAAPLVQALEAMESDDPGPDMPEPVLPPLRLYHMTIGVQFSPDHYPHPYLEGMRNTHYVTIEAPTYQEARKICEHYSGGKYSMLYSHDEFVPTKDLYYPDGEYEHLDSRTYWLFKE